MNDYRTIQFSVEDRVATLSLRRSPLNVMNMEMMQEIADALSSLTKMQDVNALVIRAEGKAFFVGVAVENHLGEKVEPMIHLFHKMFHLLLKVPCPTIAVLEGPAIGGGCELATFCDIVIASESAAFGQPEINLGLFPPVSAVVFPWMTGLNRTMELLLTGDMIDARKAYEWGLVNRVVAADQVEATLAELIEKLRKKSALSLSLTRKAVRAALASSFAGAIGKVEQIYLQELIQTHDAQEGLASFLEKRQPIWANR
ncbi:enoyl-CoA hydratase/isomerase family protein [Effusibacillus pohliae]|uniref:enoyl-CoA hydratase/isomerase family protein n=1 Tax=Effusibacillus pohliae TaxID=232270 RepID=UPI000382A390|nr:enoyl-CoA hydratase/isomerase family protein [Effusibacillus pohliae]